MSEAANSPATSSGKSSPSNPPSGKHRSRVIEGSGKYNVVCQHKRTLKMIAAIAQHSGFLYDTFIGTDLASQQSVSTQGNDSQPDIKLNIKFESSMA